MKLPHGPATNYFQSSIVGQQTDPHEFDPLGRFNTFLRLGLIKTHAFIFFKFQDDIRVSWQANKTFMEDEVDQQEQVRKQDVTYN